MATLDVDLISRVTPTVDTLYRLLGLLRWNLAEIRSKDPTYVI